MLYTTIFYISIFQCFNDFQEECYSPNSTINTIQQTKKEKVKKRIERLRIVTCREEEREWDAGNKTGRFLIAPRIMRVVAIVSVRTQSRGDNNNNDGWC